MPTRKTAPKPSRLPKAKPVFKPSVDEMKKILGPARDARLAREVLSAPARFQPKRPSRQIMKALVAKTGLDLDKVEQLTQKYRADRRKLADEHRRRSLAQSTSLQAFLDRQVAARQARATYFAGLLPASPPYYQVIDQPDLILPTDGLELDASQIQPYNSWAKVKHHATSYDPTWRALTFYYSWQNPTATDMVITADAYIVLNGLAEADDNTGFWLLGHNATTLTLSVHFLAYDWTDWSAGLQGGQKTGSETREIAADLNAFGPGDWPESVGAIVIQNVFRGYDLRVEEMIVKPGHLMGFEVSLEIHSFIDDGAINVDFSSNAFRVMSPMVELTSTSVFGTGAMLA